jgi:DNA-directed RNA polymerase subunit RPC12/RpoP
MNDRTPTQAYLDYGLPVGASEVDRVAARHAHALPHGHRLASGGEGCPTCVEHLAELWPAATHQRLDAALIDRQDELDRRREDRIPSDAQPVDDLPLLSCAACSIVRLGYEVTGWPLVQYRCQHCGEPWTALRREGVYARQALACPECRADAGVEPDEPSVDPLEEYACLECGVLWAPAVARRDRLPVMFGRLIQRILRRLAGGR